MKTLTIKRSEWVRGEGYEPSRLLTVDGRRCCLGFACQQLAGVNDYSMLDVADPDALNTNARDYAMDTMAWLFSTKGTPSEIICGSHDMDDLIEVNDNERGSNEVPGGWREKRIAAIFAKHDIEVIFVD